MSTSTYQKVTANIEPLENHILVVNMESGERKIGSIIIRDDNGMNHGIRPRWAQVYKVGTNVDYVKPGQYVLIEHGRWTFGIEVVIPEGGPDEVFYVQRVDPKGLLLVSDENPANTDFMAVMVHDR